MIEPALTAEEWERLKARDLDIYHRLVEWDGHEHMIAAVALYGQPFGFTREMAVRLRSMASFLTPGNQKFVRDLAELVEAMLPPKKG